MHCHMHVTCIATYDIHIVTNRTFSLALNVLLNGCGTQYENCCYLVVTNKMVPLIDLAVLVLSRALSSRQQQLAVSREATSGVCPSTTLCGSILRLLASVVSTLAAVPLSEEDSLLMQQITDTIR